jgi:16S rRNA (guanine966-N2)-methyltransferase
MNGLKNMRIIAGTHKGRRLYGPQDKQTTRPMTDRVKTALFDRLSAADRIEEAVVVDLFAGTGSLGLESLSRGAAHVTFVERDRVALDRLKRNLNALGHRRRQANVVAGDALAASILPAFERRRPTLIFLDPPYRMMTDRKDNQRIARQAGRLARVGAPGALLVLRADKHAEPPAVTGWTGPTTYPYGSMNLHFYASAD